MSSTTGSFKYCKNASHEVFKDPVWKYNEVDLFSGIDLFDSVNSFNRSLHIHAHHESFYI